jgi:succinate dehydrogenase/fumarate reductase flavoprotein subunit
MNQGSQRVPVEEFEYKVRRIINDYVVPPKNEYKLDRALWWMERFHRELSEEVRVQSVHDLFKAYEIENIIQCATLCAHASKERKESRWGMWHFRTDYPERNDAEWTRHIVLSRGDDPEDVRVSHREIQRLQENAR